MRRTALRLCGVLCAGVVAVTVSACAGSAAGGGGGAAEGDPIKIALVFDASGPNAALGASQKAGVEFAVAEANEKGGVAGRKIEVYSADAQSTPDGAVAAAQQLVQRDGAKFIIGMVTSPATLAISQRLESWDALAIADQAQLNDLTGKNCNARLFRTTQNDTMSFNSIGRWLKDNPLATWDTMSQDYSWGRNSAAAMQQGVQAQGGSVGKALFAPIGTSDFAANLSQLAGGDGLFVSSNGSDAVNFFKQGLDFGTFTKYKTVVGNTAFSSATLDAVTDPRLVGMWNQNTWAPAVDNPESKAFVAAYTTKTGKAPTDVAGFAYLGMQTLFAGIEKAQSIDPKTVAKGLEGLEFDSIKGKVTMRAADHQLEAPVYMGQVEQVDGKNRLVERVTYPASETLPPPDGSCKLTS